MALKFIFGNHQEEVAPSTSTPGSRSAQPQLFQPIDYRYRTYSSPEFDAIAPTGPYTYDHELEGTGGPGPTWDYVDNLVKWQWSNKGGDWIDQTGTPQGNNPFVSILANSGSNTTYNQDVTNLLQYVQTNNRWCAFRVAAGTDSPRTIAALKNSNAAYRPKLDVVYTDTTTETLECKITAAVFSGQSTCVTWNETMALPVMMEFAKPSKPVSSASLRLTVTTQFSGSQPITINPCNPPVTNPIQAVGIASTLYLDEGLATKPGVLYAHTYPDGTLQSDVISGMTSNLYDADYSPDVFNPAATADTSKLPYVNYGKWINANYAGAGAANLSLVDSSYTGEGFEPLFPGIGALKTTIPATAGLDDGYATDSSGSTGCIARMFLPINKMGTLSHFRMRYYFRLHPSRPLEFNDRKIGTSSGAKNFLQFTGKWGPSPTHDTTQGGFSGSSGSGWGWQLRNKHVWHLHSTTGPDNYKVSIGTHIKDDFQFQSQIDYRYLPGGFNEMFADAGASGSTIGYDEWHSLEIEHVLNTLLPNGLGCVNDGVLRYWIDGKLAFERTGMHFRSLPTTTGTLLPVATPAGTNVGNGTFVNLASYNGSFLNTQAIPETLTITFTSPTTFNVNGSFYGAYAAGTVGVDYQSARKHDFRIDAGSTPWQAGDSISVLYGVFSSPTVRSPIKELGVRDVMLNWFHGGKTDAGADLTLFITAIAYGDGAEMTGGFGPIQSEVQVSTLPSWVPAAGEVATYITGGAVVTNNFISQAAPYYDPFYYAKTANAYSGSVVNPFWGDYGALIFFGGGHSATNDNSVTALILGQDTMVFKRLTNPSPIYGSGTDSTTKGNNSIGAFSGAPYINLSDTTYADGQPASPHSYASTVILPPAVGSSAGSLFIPLIGAACYQPNNGMGSFTSFKVPFDSISGSTGSYNWQKVTTHPTYPYGTVGGSELQPYIAAPVWSVYDSAFNRTIYESAKGFVPRWFDHNTNTYVQGTGTSLDKSSSTTDTGAMILVRERNLAISLLRQPSGNLQLRYMDISVAQPSWVNTPRTLSSNIIVPVGWSAACWCPDAQGGAGRIIIGDVQGDTTAVTEITIPNSLNDTWAVTRAPFGAGQSITWSAYTVYNKWMYNPKVKSIVFVGVIPGEGNHNIKVYRPRGVV